ncbi:hypothetical protein J6590_095797 [Homalodisca vitripennis]|nr:hypothetical protein J6590_095797 [Homalodisca vitripennis]
MSDLQQFDMTSTENSRCVARLAASRVAYCIKCCNKLKQYIEWPCIDSSDNSIDCAVSREGVSERERSSRSNLSQFSFRADSVCCCGVSFCVLSLSYLLSVLSARSLYIIVSVL